MKARTFLVILFTLIFITCTVIGIAEDFDWPRWRGPSGDGISMETGWNPKALSEDPKILWKTNVGLGYSNVTIKDGRLYTMGLRGRTTIIFSLNAETGEEIWQYSFEDFRDPQSTPTIDGKYLYVLSSKGILFRLKIKNGKLQWERDLVDEFEAPQARFGFATSPVIEEDLVILNVKTCIALNKKNGDKVWVSEVHEIPLYDDYYATPVIHEFDGRRCALIFSGRGLFSVDVMTGEKIWYYEWKITGSPNCVDPIAVDNKIYTSSAAMGGCVCLEIIDGEPSVLWKNSNMNNAWSTSVLIDDYLYGCDGYVYPVSRFGCLDFNTGSVMWTEKMREASAISAGGKLIILGEDGTLRIAKATPESYQEISHCDVLEGEEKGRKFWTIPVLCNGKIYCRNYFGDLICIDVSK